MPETKETAVFVLIDLQQKRALLEKRGEGGSFAGQIIFPGGSQIKGENLLQTVHREAKEELGVDINKVEKIEVSEPIFGETGKRLHVFTVTDWTGKIPTHVLDKGNELLWVNLTDLGKTITVKSSRKIAANVLAHYRRIKKL